jgi:hypothetical protein
LYGMTRSVQIIVHHSVNTERSIPARRRVHNVPLDDTLTVVADDFLSPALEPLLELALLEELPATVISPEISENKRTCKW